MVDINSPSMVMLNLNDLSSELNEESKYVKQMKNSLKSVRFPNTIDGQYINYMDSIPKEYSNFMEMTAAPQRNPYGLTGNKEAMKELELQKPARQTTKNNPFMNVPLTDYGVAQNYGRSESECGSECKKNFYRSLFQSPSDNLWQKSASERQYYTTANTSVPNEQVKFAQWLYGNNQVGKTGSIYDRYGYPYTADSLVNTGVNAASPQNAGQIENNYGTPMVPGASPWVNNPNYGYGFGGIPGGIPYNNAMYASPMYQLSPYPMMPHFSPSQQPPNFIPPM